MLPVTDHESCGLFVLENGEPQIICPRSTRTRVKLPSNLAHSNENATALLNKAPCSKPICNQDSILTSNPIESRILRPISANINIPVRISSPTKVESRRFRSGSEGKIKYLQPDASVFDSFRRASNEKISEPSVPIQAHLSKKAASIQNRVSSRHLRNPANFSPNGHSAALNCKLPADEDISPRTGSNSNGPVQGPQSLPSTFFEPGIILPGPLSPVDVTEEQSENSDPFAMSPLSRTASRRLQTMLLKQRRVDFEPEEPRRDLPQRDGSLENQVNDLDEQSRKRFSRSCTGAKVRCALSEAERLLGIKWIHNVDTTSTTNPQIAADVRYHASLLFSLYWGSRSPKVAKPVVPITQQKSARDLLGEREAKKKMKLIAATAMACLTLTIKWHFDFCKPLFSLQLLSFCKTTDFRTFRVTPEDLIIAERAILFSYPIAGGLWLDSPHAFLNELVHIIPTLKLLFSVPQRKNFQRGVKDSDSQVPKNGFRRDWPKVIQKFDNTLAKATMRQEVLAFEPSVLCVVTLYLSLDAVEPGYYEKVSENKTGAEKPATDSAVTQDGTSSSPEEAVLLESQKKEVNVPSKDEIAGSYVWKWLNINETMNQVCQITQVAGEDVESCLDWVCQSD